MTQLSIFDLELLFEFFLKQYFAMNILVKVKTKYFRLLVSVRFMIIVAWGPNF